MTLELSLELDPEADPIAGAIRDHVNGSSWPFRGWLELAAALQECLRSAAPEPEQ